MGDVALVGVVSEGRDAAFAALFTAAYADLAGYCESLVGVDAADELAQEALTRVYVRWGLVREPRAYAFRIATNLARERWRRRSREQELWQGVAERDAIRTGPDPEVWDLVQWLPERLRDVVLLHYLADLPVAEVAAATRRPVGTVKRRLHEARQLLAAALEEDS